MKRSLKVYDLFAGAGGFSLGFDMAGFEVVGAIESDKWACETFAANHPHADVVCEKIEKLTDEYFLSIRERFKPDIVIGGPPCQGFSISNRNAKDPKDPRNSMFREFIRATKHINPSIAIMENVPNLIKAKTEDGTPVISIICEDLKHLGYKVKWQILSAVDYGVPQIRKRLIVIASKAELKSPFPLPTHQVNRSDELFSNSSLLATPTLWDAISDLPAIEACEGSEEQAYQNGPQNDYQVLMRKGSHTLYNHKAMNHSKRMIERFASMSSGQSGSDVPEHLKPRKRNSQEISAAVYDQNNRRMFADKPCHTLAASFYANFVHPYLNRNFTAREGARIQSFPDWYVFKGKPTVISHKLLAKEGREEEKYLCQYNQIGNAVPPLLAKAIAENLKAALLKEESYDLKEAA